MLDLGSSRRLVIAGCLLTVSCTDGLFKELGRERSAIANDTIRIATSDRTVMRLTWKQARDRMLREELSLRQAESRLAELQRQRENQWREWLPRPTFYINLQNSLQELGDFSGDDVSGAIYAPLTIPNPWSQTAKAYQYALQEVQATDSLRLNRRRQTISLYRLFSEWERMEDRPRRDAVDTLDEEVRMALLARDSQISDEERRQLYQSQLSRMLNLPGTNVIPHSETLPNIDYEAKLDRLIPGKNYGHLATRLASYEIEAALLRRKGLRLTEWPTPNFNASVPSVYDSRREGDQFIRDTEDISLFASWSKSIDLTGREASNIESGEENLVYVRESLRLKLDAEGRTWDRLRNRYRALIAKRVILRERLAATLHGAGPGGAAEETLNEARRLLSDLENLERAKRDLDMEIWLWDDAAWRSYE
jgi:hypothetical protein